jgi:hypothetical protein
MNAFRKGQEAKSLSPSNEILKNKIKAFVGRLGTILLIKNCKTKKMDSTKQEYCPQ